MFASSNSNTSELVSNSNISENSLGQSQDKMQDPEQLFAKLEEQKKAINELNAKIDNLTVQIQKMHEGTKITNYTPHIFAIMCILFLVAQSFVTPA